MQWGWAKRSRTRESDQIRVVRFLTLPRHTLFAPKGRGDENAARGDGDLQQACFEDRAAADESPLPPAGTATGEKLMALNLHCIMGSVSGDHGVAMRIRAPSLP